MNKELNNFTLDKRIDEFKKRYNELLLEMNNSSFLNLSKFTNGDLMLSNDNNISTLLEENNQLTNNIHILKDSIKEKLKNLELLLEKSKINPKDYDEYVKTYEQIISLEKETALSDDKSQELFSKQKDNANYNKLDKTINKIDEFKDYIEEKILNEIEKSEKEKAELSNIVETLNNKIKGLLNEQEVSKNLITELKVSNDQMQLECDRTIESWVRLSSQLDSLSFLIEHNEAESRQINAEKDYFIQDLENKINDLLFRESKKQNAVDEETYIETYLANVSDIFIHAIYKVFFNFMSFSSESETKYEINLKKFKEAIWHLVDVIEGKHTKKVKSIIENIEEVNVESISPLTDQYAQVFNEVSIVDDIINLFVDFFGSKINFISNKVLDIKDILVDLNNTSSELFNEVSDKKISSILKESDVYTQRIDLFVQQINDFLVLAEQYAQNAIDKNEINDYYWGSFAVFLDEIIVELDKDYQVINDIRTIFFNYLYPEKNKHNIVHHNIYDVDSQNLENINHIYQNNEVNEHNFLDNDENLQLEIVFNNVNSEIENVNSILESENQDKNNETNYKERLRIEASNILDEINNSEEFDFDNEKNIEIEEIVEIQEVNDINQSNKEEDEFISLSENVINFDANEDTNQTKGLLELNENNDEKQVEEVLTKDVLKEIDSYIELCDVDKPKQRDEIIKLIKDHTQPLSEKIDRIEAKLYELLNVQSTTITKISKKDILIQKKYNKNLKLRLIKSKLYNIKLRLEEEQDSRYLEIIKGLEE